MTTGNDLLARALDNEGVEKLYYLMAGPMLSAERACIDRGIDCIDVRHEQAAAMMAHAYSRLEREPGVCAAGSGPGVENLVTGVGNAWADRSPVVVLGGSNAMQGDDMGDFQEVDQVSLFEPVTKWTARVQHTDRIPEYVRMAFRQAMGGRPGPVYLDLPADVLHGEPEGSVEFPGPPRVAAKPAGDPAAIEEVVDLLAEAERPIALAGNGVLWSDAGEELREFVEGARLPLYTTPEAQGILPDGHPLSVPRTRSHGYGNTDLVLVLGTRFNFVNSYGGGFADDARIVQVDIHEESLGNNRDIDVGVVGDCRRVIEGLSEAAAGRDWTGHEAWIEELADREAEKREEHFAQARTDEVPIHPLRLFSEVAELMDDDAVIVADGQEALIFQRKVVPTNVLGHRLNPGPSGCMGVGVPFGIAAADVRPDTQVIVLSGDGSFGMNAIELDTAARRGLDMTVVISNNGGWTADVELSAGGERPGRDLGYTRYDELAETLGCHGEFVEEPGGIRPALERALESDSPAVVNALTDPEARAASKTGLEY